MVFWCLRWVYFSNPFSLRALCAHHCNAFFSDVRYYEHADLQWRSFWPSFLNGAFRSLPCSIFSCFQRPEKKRWVRRDTEADLQKQFFSYSFLKELQNSDRYGYWIKKRTLKKDILLCPSRPINSQVNSDLTLAFKVFFDPLAVGSCLSYRRVNLLMWKSGIFLMQVL